MKDAYERLVRPLLFSIDPEIAHRLTIGSLRVASRVDLALRALRLFQPIRKPKRLFGLNFPNPIGLAAGLDKNGVALPAWAALGFGFIEIGTVTARLSWSWERNAETSEYLLICSMPDPRHLMSMTQESTDRSQGMRYPPAVSTSIQ